MTIEAISRSCPLCQHIDRKILLDRNNWRNLYKVAMFKCNHCNFIYSGEDKFDYINFFPSIFSSCGIEELMNIALKEGLDRMALDLIRLSELKYGANILDFGSGVGLTALVFKKNEFNVSAVESSEKYLEKLRSLGIAAFSSLELARESTQQGFDLVIAKDVLEHVAQPVEMLKKLVASVKDGGYIYLRVPNVNAYWCLRAIDTMGHINHFTPKVLINLAKQAGLINPRFVGVYDVSTLLGKIYHSIFWRLRYFLPLDHQISILFQKAY